MLPGFKNPPAENRPRPFWFWNGDMERGEIKSQIAEMRDKGLGGFFLCARQGLRVPYLSREWFDLCRFAVDTAREMGLEVWLYDEYPYPSGMSGGEVTLRRPEAKAKELGLLAREVTAGETLEANLGEAEVLTATAWPVREGIVAWDEPVDLAPEIGILQTEEIYQLTEGGLNYRNSVKRYFTYGPSKILRWTPPEPEPGSWRVLVAYERVMEDFKYYGAFIDAANPDAVRCFLDTTYEPYKKALGEDFGKTVRGMFADETGFLGRWPWSGELPAYFEGKYGYSLLPNLSALLDASVPNAMRVRYHYFQCVHELLRDRYHKTISRWCEENGILYVTEIPSARMSNQMYSHVPGGDPCHDKLGVRFEDVIDRDFHILRSNPKAIGAMARQFGRRDALIEAFHSIGWTKTLQDVRWQIDRQTLMGITLHNFHAYYYTMNGITKHDAPPSQFLQNPYWEFYRLFADYCGHSSRFVTETEPSVRVALLHPALSWMTRLRNPFLHGGYVGEDAEEEAFGGKLMADYKGICKALFRNQIEYEDLDPEVMAMGSVEGGRIRVGRAVYDTLVIPPVTYLEGYAQELIERFAEGGGKVVAIGLSPYDRIEAGVDPARFASLGGLPLSEYDGEAGKAFTQSRGNLAAVHTPGGVAESGAEEEIARAILAFAPNRVEALFPAEQKGSVVVARRESPDASFIMISSQDGVLSDAKALFRDPPADAHAYELDLENGNTYALEFTRTQDGILVDAPVTPWASRVIGLSGKEYPCVERPAATARFQLELDSAVPYEADRPNVYRLEELAVSIEGGDEFAAKPSTLIEHLRADGSGFRKLAFSDGFGLPRRLSPAYPIRAAYRFRFDLEALPSGEVWLLRDRMGIMGEHTIEMNGKPLDPASFAERRVYDQNNIAAPVSAYLRAGENEILVRVTAEKGWHGLSDPMYLLGDFGVLRRGNGFVIGKAPERILPTAKAPEGYPFYSGKLCYELTLPCEGEPGASEIELPERYRIYECCALTVNGQPLGSRVFSPYVWRCPAGILKAGANDVRLTVTGTLGNMLEGVYYDYEKKRTVLIPDEGE